MLEAMFLFGIILFVLLLSDIISKTRMAVKALRYLGTSGVMNPLEAKEFTNVLKSLEFPVTNIEGGKAMVIAKDLRHKE